MYPKDKFDLLKRKVISVLRSVAPRFSRICKVEAFMNEKEWLFPTNRNALMNQIRDDCLRIQKLRLGSVTSSDSSIF